MIESQSVLLVIQFWTYQAGVQQKKRSISLNEKSIYVCWYHYQEWSKVTAAPANHWQGNSRVGVTDFVKDLSVSSLGWRGRNIVPSQLHQTWQETRMPHEYFSYFTAKQLME